MQSGKLLTSSTVPAGECLPWHSRWAGAEPQWLQGTQARLSSACLVPGKWCSVVALQVPRMLPGSPHAGGVCCCTLTEPTVSPQGRLDALWALLRRQYNRVSLMRPQQGDQVSLWCTAGEGSGHSQPGGSGMGGRESPEGHGGKDDTLGNLCGERGTSLEMWYQHGAPRSRGRGAGCGVCSGGEQEFSLMQGNLCHRHTSHSQTQLFVRAEAGNNVHARCFLELCTSTPVAPFIEQKVEEMCFLDSPFSWSICGH